MNEELERGTVNLLCKHIQETKAEVSELCVIHMVVDLAMGFLHATSLDFLHRDLHLSNLLLSADGRVRLADFSEARKTEAGVDYSADVGNDIYRAPEVSIFYKDHRHCDVFSFGLVFANLLSYVTLKDSDEPTDYGYEGSEHEQEDRAVDWFGSLLAECQKEVIRKKKAEAFRQIKPFRHYQQIIEKCLKVDYNSRPSFVEVIRDLHKQDLDLDRGREELKALISKSFSQ